MTASALSLEYEEHLETCLEQVFARYLTNKSLLVYDGRRRHVTASRHLEPPSYTTFQLDSILKILEAQQIRAVTINDKRFRRGAKVNKYKVARATSCFFVFDENQALEWQVMDPMFKSIKTRQYFKRQGRILVLVYKNHTNSDEDDEMAKNIIAAIWRWNKSVNVVVMIADPDKIYFYNWFPYRYPDCRWVYAYPPYEVWKNKTFLYNKDLFPEKIKRNFEGCPVRVTSADCVPYTFENYTLGFEASLVNTLAKFLNFTMQKVSVPKGESLWMTRYDNGTTAGAFGLLDRQSIDLAYACLMLNLERYNLAECLPTYYHDSLTWFVPTPEKKTHASNVFEAFPAQYWWYIVITTVSALCIFLLINKLEEYALAGDLPETLRGAVLRVFAMAISSPISLSTKNTLLRIFTFAFAIYSLHITTIYQASLYNLYKSETYTKIYHNLEEAINDNLFVWLRESTKNLYSPEDRLFKIILQEGRHDYLGADLEDPFNQVAYDKTAIVLFIKSTMLTYIKEYYTDELKQPLIAFLPEQFASYPVTLYLSPGHPMFEIMSDTMLNIIASGLIDFWLSQVVKYTKDNPSNIASKLSLQLEHISGAFMFYGALISLAAGIFLIEMIYWLTHGKKVRRKLQKEEVQIRRQLLFQTVVHLGRDKLTQFKRVRTTK